MSQWWNVLSLPQSEIRRLGRLSRTGFSHLPELDGVRGYACVSVLLAHCLIGLIVATPHSFLYELHGHTICILLAGVDLFFVLSGFLIGGILMDAKSEPHFFKRFWIRRAARIFPVLWLLMASYACALWVRQHFNFPQMDLWLLMKPQPPFWTFLTFCQSIPLAIGGYSCPRWVGITWSLAIEDQFYMVFPFLVYFVSRRSLVCTVISGILVAPFFRVFFAHMFGNWFAPYVLLPSRVDGLCFGVLLAMIMRNARVLIAAARIRTVLDVLGLGILILMCTENTILATIWPEPICGAFPPLKPTCLGLLGAIVILRIFLYQKSDFLNTIWRSKWLMNFGLISYGLYMYHQSVNGTVHAFMWGQEPRIATWPQFFGSLFVMSFATAIATASYHLVEKPIRKAAHRVCSKLTTRKGSKSDRKLAKEFGSVLGNQASKPGLDRETDGSSLVGASKSQ